MKTDLTWVYIMLYITMISSCSGPSSSDVRALKEDIKNVSAECRK